MLATINCYVVIIVWCAWISLSWGMTLTISPDSNVVGEIQYASAEIGETLADVGLRYDMGLAEMIKANPHLAAQQILAPNTRVTIPSRFTLPAALRRGIVIDLAAFRLYYFPPEENVVFTYPVGIGRKGWETPAGVTTVIAKVRNPSWRPSRKLQAEGEKQGLVIPAYFPPNESNPLGRFALRLGWPSYLIHGTNQAAGVGEQVSAGCIRMLPEDIESLFNQTEVGTPVRVIHEPIIRKM